jgi:hypothetical protein
MNDVPDLVRDRLGLNEEVVRPTVEAFPGPFQVNNSVNDKVSDMHSLRAQFTRHRFG